LIDTRTLRIHSRFPVVRRRALVADSKTVWEFMRFTPDGRFFLMGASWKGWARHACNVAGHPLTRAQWDEVLPGRDYDPAC
jgi:hypothetical protein